MNNTEYTSLTAMITAIEAQINSLKTILASIANQKTDNKKHNVKAQNQAIDQDGYLMSEEEEKDFAILMENARKQELARMAAEADKHFRKEMDEISKEVTNEPE
jgi:hypothetical protein